MTPRIFFTEWGGCAHFDVQFFFPFFPRGTWTKKKRKGGKKNEIAGSRLLFVTNFWEVGVGDRTGFCVLYHG
jgi:hypothetical protein